MAGIMNRPSLAVIGAGAMARYHIDAARYVGYEVTGIAASPRSSRARRLAEELGIGKVHDHAEDLIGDPTWDAMVIAVDVPATLNLALAAAESGRPVLVEKPVAEFAADLKPHLGQLGNLHVAYNRRFYPSTQAAKAFVDGGGPGQVMAQIPEGFAGSADSDRGRAVRYNSVHVLDLLRFLLGQLQVEHVGAPGISGDDLGRIALLRSDRGDACVIYANWDHPANFAVQIDQGGQRFEMKPLELGFRFDGMAVEEPTEERPLRVYSPLCVEEVGLEAEADRFKPGFVGQMRAFRAVVDSDHEHGASPLAGVADAYEALVLAEALVEGDSS